MGEEEGTEGGEEGGEGYRWVWLGLDEAKFHLWHRLLLLVLPKQFFPATCYCTCSVQY